MAEFEMITLSFGKVKRRYAPIKSPTLLAMPKDERPTPLLGCTTCPAGSWYASMFSLSIFLQLKLATSPLFNLIFCNGYIVAPVRRRHTLVGGRS